MLAGRRVNCTLSPKIAGLPTLNPHPAQSFPPLPRLRKIGFLRVMFSTVLLANALLAQTIVTTWHYDNARTSANTTETELTPANVNSKTFGKLSSKPVDGLIVGHALYLENVSIAGHGIHNVAYVATMHDSVYAFDADSPDPNPLWMTSILANSPAGATTVSSAVKLNAVTTGWDELGIVSTPVIDPASGMLYLVAETYENGNVVHRLHALDVTNGLEKLGGPVTIAATSFQNGKTTTFTDLYQMNRPPLMLANGHIYIAWGSNGNNTLPCQGWVLSYNAATLQQEGAFTTEPGQNIASIWQRGAGLSADSAGNIYAETGEGPYSPGTNLSISVIKLGQVGTSLSLLDWFTPFNHTYLSVHDLDLAEGILLLPDQPGRFPHELVALGKEGTVYVLNRDPNQMGQLCSSCTTVDTQIIQELTDAIGPESGAPVYWNNMVYFTPIGIPVVAYHLANGTLGTPFSAPSSRAGGNNGLVTANGNSNGILWFLNGNILVALDAVTLQTLYLSGQAPNGRDVLPAVNHLPTPIVADGKVFVGTQNSLVTFGLFSSSNNTTTTNLSSSANPSTMGQRVTFTAAVSSSSGNIPDADSVTFKNGTIKLGTAAISNGSASITVSTLTLGIHSISATFNGDTAYAPSTGALSQQVQKPATTTTVSSSSNPSILGQSVTFTATVSSSGGGIPKGETVIFKNGANTLGTSTLFNGTTSITVNNLPGGTNVISATYAGDATFSSSFGSVSQKVNKNNAAATVSSALNPSNLGQAVNFTVTVTSNVGNVPDGESVTLKNGPNVLGTGSLSSGTVTLTVNSLPAGTNVVSAFYNGDATFAASTGTVSQKVQKNSTTTALASNLNPSAAGQAVTFTATVTSPVANVPDGESVVFNDGATVLGTGTLSSGRASVTVSTLPAGNNSVSAWYNGDSNFTGGSASIQQTVQN